MDSDDTTFKLNITLQHLSSVAIVTRLFNLQDVIDHRRVSFAGYAKCFCCYKYEKDDIKTACGLVDDHLEKLQLPEPIEIELKKIVYFIGKKIFCWTKHVQELLKLNMAHAENISWTCYGSIDEFKTFQLYWTKHLTFDITNIPENNEDSQDSVKYEDSDDSMMGLSLFDSDKLAKKVVKKNLDFTQTCSLACAFAQIGFITSNFKEMKRLTRAYLKHIFKIPQGITQHSLIKLWICYYLKDNAKEAYDLYEGVRRKGDYSDAKMMEMCAEAGLFSAVEYFANNLTNHKDKFFYRTAAVVISMYTGFYIGINTRKEAHFEILLFLINGMSFIWRYQFLLNHLTTLFDVWIDLWPYQDVILEIFNSVFHSLSEENLSELFDKVLKYLSDTENDYLAEGSRQFLQKIMLRIPNELKREKFLFSKTTISKIIETENFKSLKLVASNAALINYRKQIMADNFESFKKLVADGKFKSLNKFMDIMLKDDNEKKEFKLSHNHLQDFLKEEKFELTDKLLYWMSDSKQEKVTLKRQINASELCLSHIAKDGFDLAKIDKLLKWIFDSNKEEMMVCKKSMELDKYIADEFCKTWCNHCIFSVELSKVMCAQLLEWFLRPDEIDSFKRYELIQSENFMKTFCKYLHFPDNFNSIDELFSFCGVGTEIVKDMKQNMREKVKDWFELFCVKKKNFRLGHILINWIADDEVNEIEIIEKYMASYKGNELLQVALDACRPDEDYFEPLLIILNYWVKPFVDLSDIKLWFWSSISKREKFKLLLEKLKNNFCVGCDDLNKLFEA